jgi:hypothetical protein
MRSLVGNQLQQAIHVAAALGVADALAGAPLDLSELASRVGAEPEALRRLLRVLAAFGIFELLPDGRAASNPASSLLRDNVPGSLRPFALWSGGVSYQAFGGLGHSVRTGTPAFEHLFGQQFFEYLAEHQRAGELFDDMMAWITRPLCPALVARDFSNVRTVADLGGGRGDLLVAVLEGHPHLRGMLVDKRLGATTHEMIADAGIKARCDLVVADIQNEVPPGADLYLLKSVLHGLDDAHALRVLENCRQAMGTGATLMVIELVLPDGTEPSPAWLMDLLMLVGCHGRERTRAEFEQLLSQAGFRSIHVEPATQAFHIIEAQ